MGYQIYVTDSWRFIDCHWGARHVTGPGAAEDPNNFCYEYDEFFFLTDPEDNIYMHFPDEPEWQLIDKRVTLDRFTSMPLVKSNFFHYGLKPKGTYDAVLETDTGRLEISFRKPSDIPLSFNTRLEADDEHLDGYVIHRVDPHEVVFTANLPRRGVFFFTIFACDTERSDAYSNVCSFRIKCTKVETKPVMRFPKLLNGYGTTPLASELGLLVDSLEDAFTVLNDEKLILNLRFGTDVKVSHKLISGNHDMPIEGFDRHAFQRYRDDRFLSYLIRFPQKGVYCFSLYAAEKNSKASVLECACRFVIQCNVTPSGPPKIYPRTHQYWLGCRLHEPSTGDLKINKNIKFKVEVPGADAVAVIASGKWYYLKKGGDKLWEGNAHMGKEEGSTAGVYAQYETRDFFPLLEYKLIK